MVLNFEYRHAKIHLEFVHAPTLRDTIVSDNYVVSHLASVPSTLTEAQAGTHFLNDKMGVNC